MVPREYIQAIRCIVTVPVHPFWDSGPRLVRDTIVNRTYVHTKIYFPIFTNNVWSYLLWSPVTREKYQIPVLVYEKHLLIVPV